MSNRSLHELAARAEADVPLPRFRWGSRVALPVALLLSLVAALGASVWNVGFAAGPMVELSPVVEKAALTAPSSIADSANSTGDAVARAAGWIEPDPYPIAVSALVGGSAREVFFLEGDAVREGDAMASLVDDDARLALRRAQAELDAAKRAWEANVDATRGLAVAEEAEAEASATLAMERARVEEERSLLAGAEKTYQRRAKLMESGSVNESDFTDSETEYLSRQARLIAARAAVEVAEAKWRAASADAVAQRTNAELRIDERLRLERAEVDLAEAALRLERHVVRASIDGVVLRRLVEPGSRLMLDGDHALGSAVAVLYDPARLQVRVDVPLADAPKIGAGQPAEIAVEASPGKIFRGVLTRWVGEADIEKNTIQAKVSLRDPDSSIRPEMLARVRFLALASANGGAAPAKGATALFAPAGAIAEGVAWVAMERDGATCVVRQRQVALTGAEADGWLEVASGLLPGDQVVVDGAAGLREGDRVRTRGAGK